MNTRWATLPVILAGMFLVLASRAPAQSLSINGGNITLRISSGMAGGDLIDDVNTTVTLAYQRQSALSKITVRTSCIGQSFDLEVLATNVTAGTASPAVMLQNGSPAIDFIRDIAKNGPKNQSCWVRYTASATFAQGNSTELGQDNHTVTYTIQSQ